MLGRSPVLVLLMVALGGESAVADIIVWHDAAGGVHYTNSLEGVPADRREEATTFVKERPRAAPEPEPTPVEPEVSASASAPLMGMPEEAIEDRLIRAFAAGVEAAHQAENEEGAEVAPANMVQSTEVLVEAPERDAILVGGFAPEFPVRRRPREPDLEPEEDEAPFVVGPAGPPPIGAAGPPPVVLVEPR